MLTLTLTLEDKKEQQYRHSILGCVSLLRQRFFSSIQRDNNNGGCSRERERGKEREREKQEAEGGVVNDKKMTDNQKQRT